MVRYQAAYPTPEHESAARRIVEYFSTLPETQAVVLVNSASRGKATRDSCLDISILLPANFPDSQIQSIDTGWQAIVQSDHAILTLKAVGRYSQVDLDLTRGLFQPDGHGWTSGPDDFELEIGNLLAYSTLLWERGGRFQDLKAQWLPYYPSDLRAQRLSMVVAYALNNLDHIPLYIERGLYFQAFNRLYHALGEFLQALFIARRTYPIAYDKWIKEQIVDILGLPEVYEQLTHLLEIQHFESPEIGEKARLLRRLIDDYTQDAE